MRSASHSLSELRATRPHRSYWLQEALGDLPDAPALRGTARADILIVGGGFVGLRTALQIKQMEPACDVTIVEQDVCGSGASGRNGGFVMSWWPKLTTLIQCFGEQDALRIGRDSQATIAEIDVFCRAHRIDAHFEQRGWLWTATSRAQRGAWNSVVSACERLGLNAFESINPSEVARRCGSPAHLEGVFDKTVATVQPAILARGLRRVALERGVRIFEHTRMRRIGRGSPVRVQTDEGVITADRLIIATNAWAANIAELSRSIVAVTSDIVVTEPIRERLDGIGWRGGEAITDSQQMVDYYRLTRNGRIAFGKGGWGIPYGGRIGPSCDRSRKRAGLVAADFYRYYPMLRDVRITHDWSGPIDRSADGLPLIGALPRHANIFYGIGWSGNGVGPSAIGARCLASLALERRDEWASYPLVNRRAQRFPPTPIKYVGAHVVRSAVVSKERAEMQGRKPSWLAATLARFVPAGLEDKQ